ncbi:hypothetical protein CCP3SC15_7030001 [Gammaproteobacteria bacterium]
MTLLVSSHILVELAEYSTDMLVLKAGRVVDQRPIAPSPTAAVSLELILVEPWADIGKHLAVLSGVSDIEVQGTCVHFHFAGDDAARHRLLRTMINDGIAVCGLSAARQEIQASYLASVRSSGKKKG